MTPYGLIADLHLHNWQAFSGVNEQGVNTRLAGLLSEVERCADEVKKAGGDKIYIAGDVFHVRGSVAPSVLNPTLDLFMKLNNDGMNVVIIPGNHDLEGKHATRLGSAVTALEHAGCDVHDGVYVDDYYTANRTTICIPWRDSLEVLKGEIESLKDREDASECDLILHAPIDGVITGLPHSGLDPEWLGNLGFRSVYAGHYHHHKEFNHNVFSIGALAHHSWSDVRSKAGFLIVGDTGPKWFKSHLPEFVDIDSGMDEAEIAILCEGNFVRGKVNASKPSEVEELREFLKKNGALGVVIQTVKTPTRVRESGSVAATVSAGSSLEVSVSEYLKSKSFPNEAELHRECMAVLAESGV